MEYNLHPIVVHFPIALLMLGALVRILPLKKLFPKVAWLDISRFLLGVGFVGGIAAHITGENAEELLQPQEDLVGAHANAAAVTLWAFGLVVFGECIRFLPEKIKNNYFVDKVGIILGNSVLQVVLLCVGLVAIFLTGLLGGVLVHGTSADPLAPLVLKILGIDY